MNGSCCLESLLCTLVFNIWTLSWTKLNIAWKISNNTWIAILLRKMRKPLTKNFCEYLSVMLLYVSIVIVFILHCSLFTCAIYFFIYVYLSPSSLDNILLCFVFCMFLIFFVFFLTAYGSVCG